MKQVTSHLGGERSSSGLLRFTTDRQADKEHQMTTDSKTERHHKYKDRKEPKRKRVRERENDREREREATIPLNKAQAVG